MVSQDVWVAFVGLALSGYLYRRSQTTKYPSLQLEAILLYPIKSLPPIRVEQATLAERGLKGDRTFMLVSPKTKSNKDGIVSEEWYGHYISERPKNALLIPTLSSDHSILSITSPSGAKYSTPMVPEFTPESRRITITMHSSSAETIDMGDEASRFFTQACGTGEETRLVYMVPKERREVLGTMGGSIDQGLAFQDCASYMVASSASLEAVRIQLDGEPLSIIPFRPTFLLSPKRGHHLAPWVEDWWA